MKPRPALRVPEAELRSSVDTICLDRVRTTLEVPNFEARLKEIEGFLASKLETGGFVVVGPEDTVQVRDSVVREKGGFFDAHTGRRDEARYEAVKGDFLRALEAELGCDAVLYPSVELVTAYWINGTATWDGAEDGLSGGQGYQGWVPALSLWVRLTDAQDRELYFGTGGLQVMAKLKVGFFERQFTRVDPEYVLMNDRRNLVAVEQSLGPLLTRDAENAGWALPGNSGRDAAIVTPMG